MSSAAAQVVIFVQAFNEQTLQQARSDFKQYSWARPILMPSKENPFFESALFVDPRLRMLEPSVEYVGQISYKASLKINVAFLDAMIKRQDYRLYDYVHFCGPPTQNVLHSGFVKLHPYFQHIWHDVFEPVGLPAIETPEMLFNFWMARRTLWISFCTDIETMRAEILSHPYALEDSKYRGSLRPEALVALCGVPWYPHVPFVMERFPVAWFLRRQYTCGFIERLQGRVLALSKAKHR